jgi:hypothetical protein
LSTQVRFILAGLKLQWGEEVVNTILTNLATELPKNTQTVLFGQKVGMYSGLTRTQIKEKFEKPGNIPLTDADVDEIFTALGVASGTGN